jgi:hypothetical protein
MTPVHDSFIAGPFQGYKPGRVYTLADGTSWRQQCQTSEYVLRHRPWARVLTDCTGRHFLDVEGTSGLGWSRGGGGHRSGAGRSERGGDGPSIRCRLESAGAEGRSADFPVGRPTMSTRCPSRSREV